MKTIVIVDDSEVMLQVLKAYIRAADNSSYEIVCFDNINEATKFIVDNTVHLLFQDMHVNDINDGMLVADIAKGLNIPVVLITADSSIDTVKKVARRGFDKFIIKPPTQTDVESALFELA